MLTNNVIYSGLFWKGLVVASNFFVNLLMARLLGASLSGSVFFLINSFYLLVLSGSLSIDSGVIYYMAKRKINDLSLPSLLVIWSLFVSVSGYLFFFFSGWYATLLPGVAMQTAGICYLSGTLLTAFFSALFFGRDDYRTPSIVIVASNGILIILLFYNTILKRLGNEDLIYLFLLSFFLQGTGIATWYFIRYRKAGWRYAQSLHLLKPLMRYSLTAFVGNIGFFLLYRIDYWIIEFYCTKESLGIYIQASKAAQLLLLLPVTLHGILFQQFSKKLDQTSFVLINKIGKLFLLGYTATAVFIYFWGPYLIGIVWGLQYSGIYAPLIRMLPGILFLAIAYLFSALFAATGNVRLNVHIAIVILLTMLVLDFILIPYFGINGAAWANSIGYFAMLLLYLFYADKRFQVRKAPQH